MTNKESFEPKILGFLCNWCCYAAADSSGISRFQYLVYAQLVEYKNKKALLNKKSKYSFTDAIKDLLEESKILAEYMKGKG